MVSDDKMFKVEVSVREYMPPLPVNVTKTPTGPAATPPTATPGTPPNPAFAALQSENQSLRVQAGNLGLPGGLP